MTKVVFVTNESVRHEVEIEAGLSVMEAAVRNNIPGIPADCGGACSCGTCVVHISEFWQAKVGMPGDYEAALLEFAEHGGPHSRLSCQIEVCDALDGLVVQVP